MEKTLNENQRKVRASKHMLWIAISSMIMMFAGIISAYVVSSYRKDWLTDFQLPMAFWWSTLTILLSSLVLWQAKRFILNNQIKQAAAVVAVSFVLGILFTILQFEGFSQIIDMGYYFTGSSSNITMTFLYLIVLVHLLHLFAGLVVLLVLLVKTLKGSYTSNHYNGFSLGATFWHFVDVLWIFLILFLYFTK